MHWIWLKCTESRWNGLHLREMYCISLKCTEYYWNALHLSATSSVHHILKHCTSPILLEDKKSKKHFWFWGWILGIKQIFLCLFLCVAEAWPFIAATERPERLKPNLRFGCSSSWFGLHHVPLTRPSWAGTLAVLNRSDQCSIYNLQITALYSRYLNSTVLKIPM